jgi:hypothetical protein
VADELCLRNEHDAAEAFAKAAPRKDTEALPAYVASRRGVAPDAAARKSVAKAGAAFANGDEARALEILSGVVPEGGFARVRPRQGAEVEEPGELERG